MAVIRAFRHEVKGFGARHSTDVDCLYFDFLDTGGSRILQLSTLGSDHRQSKPKVSQTFQIGAEGAAELMQILGQTFAGVSSAPEQAPTDSARTASGTPSGAESEDPIDRFVARAGLNLVEDLGMERSVARRRVLARDDRPLVGGDWYVVDYSNLQALRYRDVDFDLRYAPDSYQRMAIVVNDISGELEDLLVGSRADVIRLADLDLPLAWGGLEGADMAGVSQGDVPALQYMTRALGVALAQPGAAWPGFGKVVPLADGGSAYVNRTNVDVRATPAQVAAWANDGQGTVRGPQGQYLRVEYDSSVAVPANDPHRPASTGASDEPIEVPVVPKLSPTFPWTEQLFESEAFLAQKALAGRATVGDDVVRDVVNALIRSGSSGPIETVEREAGFRPGSLRPMVPLLRRLLNLDGYDTLSFSDGILALDEDLLRHQFGLSGRTLSEGDLL